MACKRPKPRKNGDPEIKLSGSPHIGAEGEFERALKGVGLPYFPPKQLRHSFGTNLRRAGVGLDTTSRLIGHRRVSTTAEVYIQPVTELELAAVDELERLVGGAERSG